MRLARCAEVLVLATVGVGDGLVLPEEVLVDRVGQDAGNSIAAERATTYI